MPNKITLGPLWLIHYLCVANQNHFAMSKFIEVKDTGNNPVLINLNQVTSVSKRVQYLDIHTSDGNTLTIEGDIESFFGYIKQAGA